MLIMIMTAYLAQNQAKPSKPDMISGFQGFLDTHTHTFIWIYIDTHIDTHLDIYMLITYTHVLIYVYLYTYI